MDKNYIIWVIQNILNKEFKLDILRKIHIYHDRVNFRCPYCHEGRTLNKKRGNIWFNKLIYICFRCGKKTNFSQLAQDFNQLLDPEKRLEIINYLNTQLTYKDIEDDLITTEFNKLLNLEDLIKIFNSGDFILTDFKPIEYNSDVDKFIKARYIEPNKYMYQAKYWYNSDRCEPVICLLNGSGSKILSMQIRNLKSGKWRVFKIYNFETLFKWIYGEGELNNMDINQLVSYDKIGAFFNILNVDFSQRITIFEGYLDSLFYPNSIGVVGVNTDVSMLENNNLDIQYFFDNDEAGFKKSEEKIKMGYPVFLWKKLFENIVEKKNDKDPYSLLWRISKIKDLNKLAELVNNPYKTLELYNFFSKDIYDIKYIPKKYKNKK